MHNPLTKPIDLNAPGAIEALFAFHRGTFGNAVMETEAPPAPADTITVPVPPAAPALDASNPAVAALIEQARQQEKDKLYSQIENLKGQVSGLGDLQKTVSDLQSSRETEIAAAAEAARKEAEENARKQWEEQDAKSLLADANKQWEDRFAALNAEREQEREALRKEAAFSEFKAQAQSMVQDALSKNEIAPELAHLVSGNNVDELRASLENVKQASEAILANVQATLQAQPPAPRGTASTGFAPVGPMDMTEQTRTLSAEQIRDMPMSEWAKIRANLPGLSQAQTNRGLFG